MLFEVLMAGNVKAHTDQICCIPEPEILRAMEQAGYTFQLDGKRSKLKDVIAIKKVAEAQQETDKLLHRRSAEPTPKLH